MPRASRRSLSLSASAGSCSSRPSTSSPKRSRNLARIWNVSVIYVRSLIYRLDERQPRTCKSSQKPDLMRFAQIHEILPTQFQPAVALAEFVQRVSLDFLHRAGQKTADLRLVPAEHPHDVTLAQLVQIDQAQQHHRLG